MKQTLQNLVRSYQEQGIPQTALGGKILVSDPNSVRMFDVWYLEKNYYSKPIRILLALIMIAKLVFLVLDLDFGIAELYNFNCLMEGLTTFWMIMSILLITQKDMSTANFVVRINMILYAPTLCWNFSGLIVF